MCTRRALELPIKQHLFQPGGQVRFLQGFPDLLTKEVQQHTPPHTLQQLLLTHEPGTLIQQKLSIFQATASDSRGGGRQAACCSRVERWAARSSSEVMTGHMGRALGTDIFASAIPLPRQVAGSGGRLPALPSPLPRCRRRACTGGVKSAPGPLPHADYSSIHGISPSREPLVLPTAALAAGTWQLSLRGFAARGSQCPLWRS